MMQVALILHSILNTEWLDTCSDSDKTALMHAVCSDSTSVVKMLLDKGVNPNFHNPRGWTALMYAVFQEQLENMKMLVENGACMDVQDNMGHTALMISLQRHTKVTHILLRLGASIDVQNKTGTTALMYALRFGNEEAAELLINEGANIHLRNGAGKTAINLAKVYKCQHIIRMLTSLPAIKDM